MDRRRIGRLEVSVVGLGCNTFGLRLDPGAAEAVVAAALDAGITLFDTADVYGGGLSEEILGAALGERRDEATIATKFGMPLDAEHPGGGRPEYVREAVEGSLRRLGTDRIDLYQLHRPDPEVPVEETLGALGELVRAGKVREIGCSNFSLPELQAAAGAAEATGAAFASIQNEYSLLRREAERDLLPECERIGAAFLPYFPLAGGLFTGKYRRGQPPPEGSRLAGGGGTAGWFNTRTAALVESLRVGQLPSLPRRRERLNERNLALVEALFAFAEARGHTLLELAFSWLLVRPVVTSVIAGASNPQQVRANAAAPSWSLTPEDLAALEPLLPPGE